MTAALHDDVVTTSPAPRRASHLEVRRPDRPAVGSGDPLADAAARLLSIPLRQMYAVLWRVGIIEVTA